MKITKKSSSKKRFSFLEKIRSRYHLDTRNLNNEFFVKNWHQKSGNELQNTKYLINTILALNKKLNCTAEDLMSLHKMIDNFFEKTLKWKYKTKISQKRQHRSQ